MEGRDALSGGHGVREGKRDLIAPSCCPVMDDQGDGRPVGEALTWEIQVPFASVGQHRYHCVAVAQLPRDLDRGEHISSG